MITGTLNKKQGMSGNVSSAVIYEQVLSMATAAKETAQSVREDADAGKFDGEAGVDGLPGADGKDGYTPVKGVDYFTPEDKQEISGIVMESGELQQVVKDTSEALERAENAEAIAKGISSAKGFHTYTDVINDLNAAPADAYKVGHSLYVITLGVPDLWISGVYESSEPYTYIDDVTVVATLQSIGYIRIGYYQVSMLETLKQDLTNYVKNTDYASVEKAGLVKISAVGGVSVASSDHTLTVVPPSHYHIDTRDKNYAVTCDAADYAVKKALADSKLADTVNAWTDEEKAAARLLLGAVGKTDYATWQKAGIVRPIGTYGTGTNNDILTTVRATEEEIREKKQNYKPLVPSNQDIAFVESLVNNANALTDEQKTKAQAWLGIDEAIAAAIAKIIG